MINGEYQTIIDFSDLWEGQRIYVETNQYRYYIKPFKKVDVESLGSNKPGVKGPGIAGMLQKALQERGMAMGMSSSDESDGDEDDEWD